MPEYRYTGEDARYYPTLGIEAVPDGGKDGPTVADLDEAPDGQWEPVSAAKQPRHKPATDIPKEA